MFFGTICIFAGVPINFWRNSDLFLAQKWTELEQLKDKGNFKIFDSFGNLKFGAKNNVKELPVLAQQRKLGQLSRE